MREMFALCSFFNLFYFDKALPKKVKAECQIINEMSGET